MAELVPVYFMGKRCLVPDGLTIMGAMEFSGYRLTRGCGCRGGFCGACATVYRVPGDHQIKVGLACQTQIVAEMAFTLLTYYPAAKALYDLSSVEEPVTELHRLYPELFRCLGCSACTKICPQDLPVMEIVAAAQRGDLAAAAGRSFDCVMCGLCASRCLAQMVPYHIAMAARRLYARFMLPRPAYVRERIEEIRQGDCASEIDELIGRGRSEMERRYTDRDIESI